MTRIPIFALSAGFILATAPCPAQEKSAEEKAQEKAAQVKAAQEKATKKQAAEKKEPKEKFAFANQEWNSAIGLGGGAGGKYGGRRGGRRRIGGANARAIDAAHRWLMLHQAADGRFDADGFTARDQAKLDKFEKLGKPGLGAADADLLVTALATWSFLADGNTLRAGPYKAVVKRAVKWMRDQQAASGAFGDPTEPHHVAAHAVATLAMTEAYHLSKYKVLRKTAAAGVQYLDRFRLPSGGWCSDPACLDPKFDKNAARADPAVTLWCVLACTAAEDAKIEGAAGALEATRTWLRTQIDPKTGQPRRVPRDRGPFGRSAMKIDPSVRDREAEASNLFAQFVLGEKPSKLAIASVRASLPEWKAAPVSHFRWFCASHAMHQAGGEDEKAWADTLSAVLPAAQRQAGSGKGTWDPQGVWGGFGGRIYTTAMLTLTLQAPYLYARFAR